MGIDPVEVVNTSNLTPVVNTIMEASNRTEHQTIYQTEEVNDPTNVNINDYKDCKDINNNISEEKDDELVIEPLKNKDVFESDTEVLEELTEEDTEVLEEKKEVETEILEF